MSIEGKSYGIAAAWLRRAADQGNADAQNNLGWLYHNGLGVTASRVEAIAWYLQAYRQGNSLAKENLMNLGIDVEG
jgi:TPR repeat protein